MCYQPVPNIKTFLAILAVVIPRLNTIDQDLNYPYQLLHELSRDVQGLH